MGVIRDSVKYRHADTSVDYMSFLEECRKAEDEDGVRKAKAKAKGKIKIAAATTNPPLSDSDAFAKQLKKQQQQFDTLMAKVQAPLYRHTMPRPPPHFTRGALPLE